MDGSEKWDCFRTEGPLSWSGVTLDFWNWIISLFEGVVWSIEIGRTEWILFIFIYVRYQLSLLPKLLSQTFVIMGSSLIPRPSPFFPCSMKTSRVGAFCPGDLFYFKYIYQDITEGFGGFVKFEDHGCYCYLKFVESWRSFLVYFRTRNLQSRINRVIYNGICCTN